jgi:hypothetical protein
VAPTILFRYPSPAALAADLSRLREDRDLASIADELERLPEEEAARLLDRWSETADE